MSAFREARKTRHLLQSFSDAFGVTVVVVHQGVVDSPASKICIIPRVCDVAVHRKGGACEKQIHICYMKSLQKSD